MPSHLSSNRAQPSPTPPLAQPGPQVSPSNQWVGQQVPTVPYAQPSTSVLGAMPTETGPGVTRKGSGEYDYQDIATGVYNSRYIRNSSGWVDIPGNKDGFVQQYSGLGIPITDDAWERQNDIDNGKLRTCYAASFRDTLREQNPELLGKVRDEILDEIETNPDQRELFLAIIKNSAEYGDWVEEVDRSDYAEGAVSRQIQEGTLDRYLEMAATDEEAQLLLELMPTETDGRANPDGLGSLDALFGQPDELDDYRVGPLVGGFRAGAAGMADLMDDRSNRERIQGVPNHVYALPIPYGNTAEQACGMPGKRGHPLGAVATMRAYLEQLGGAVQRTGGSRPTVTATGYSQGGRAVLDYVGSKYNEGVGHVDQAVATAPMGGAQPEARCQDGVWGGQINGTRTLAIEHRDDPARWVSPNNRDIQIMGGPTLSGAANFAKHDLENDKLGFNVLHGEPYRDGPAPNLRGTASYVPPLTGEPEFEKGTWGYPTEKILPLVQDLFEGSSDYDGTYERKDWWTTDQLPPGYSDAILHARKMNEGRSSKDIREMVNQAEGR